MYVNPVIARQLLIGDTAAMEQNSNIYGLQSHLVDSRYR